MTTISAKSILASVNAANTEARVDTLLLRYPRWIHAEGRTHRLIRIEEDMEVEIRTPSLMEDANLSRNASSSRAIPVARLDPGRARRSGRAAVLGQEPEGHAG